jgi:hypothetical protein
MGHGGAMACIVGSAILITFGPVMLLNMTSFVPAGDCAIIPARFRVFLNYDL